MKNIKIRQGHRRGFSLVETSVVSFLLVALAMLLSQTASGLGRPLVQTVLRCRLDQEAELALAALAGDLGGCLSDASGRAGNKASSQFVGWTQPLGSQLWLCFDSATSPNGAADWGPPDTVVSYEVVNGALVRWNQTTGAVFVVAKYVEGMALQDLGGGELQIALSFQYRDISQTYTLIAVQP